MGSMTFLINDTSTTGTNPTVQVTVTENADGTLTFDVAQLTSSGAYLGDLRGFFFDVADESLVGTLTASSSGPLTEFQQGDDTVKDLGNGANMQGLLGSNGGYDVGVEIGSQGLGNDDIRNFSFTLDSSLRSLTLADLANMDFGVRITSVGQDTNGDGIIDTSRNGAAKLGETIFAPITAQDDAAGTVLEDTTASGNVLVNDTGPGTKVLLSVAHDATTYNFSDDDPVVITLTGGAQVTIHSNGDYAIDASSADSMYQGQEVPFDISYVVQQTVDGESVTDEAHLTGTIVGVNDAPIVTALQTSATEDGPLSIDLLTSTSDIDEGDVLSIVNPAPSLTTTGAQNLVLDTDYTVTGSTFDLTDTGLGKFQNLAEGASDTFVFDFGVSDTHQTTPNTLSVTIDGANDAPAFSGDPYSFNITEGNAIGAIVGTVLATDVDLNDPVSYAFADGGNPNGWFAIDQNTGVITATHEFDYETEATSHNLIVEARDAGGLTDTANVTVNVGDTGFFGKTMVFQGLAHGGLIYGGLVLGHFTVGNGVELNLFSLGFPPPLLGTIDFTDDQIIIDFAQSDLRVEPEHLDNFFVWDKIGVVPDITAVTIAQSNLPGFAASYINLLNEDLFVVDFAGLDYTSSTKIVLDVDFA